MSDPAPSSCLRVLFVSSDKRVARCLGRALSKAVELTMATDAPTARALLREGGFDVVVSDRGRRGSAPPPRAPKRRAAAPK